MSTAFLIFLFYIYFLKVLHIHKYILNILINDHCFLYFQHLAGYQYPLCYKRVNENMTEWTVEAVRVSVSMLSERRR